MDSAEVIVIEDSPPISPVRYIHKPIPVKPTIGTNLQNMYYQPQNIEYPVGEQAMLWSRSTSNFVKHSMNSVHNQNIRMPMVNKPMEQNRTPTPRYVPRPYTIYNYVPYGNSYYPIKTNRPYNICTKVRLEEKPNTGEIISQYYIDQQENPIRLNYTNEAIPEFIDINTFVRSMQTEKSVTLPTTNENLPTEFSDQMRKNPVPLFLKRNRSSINKMKILEERNPLTTTNSNIDDADDIIYVGEYKNEEKPSQNSEDSKSESTTTDNYYSSHDSTMQRNKYTYNYQKKRKAKIPTRRNPRRQVQIEKEFLKMIDDVISVSDKKEKQKKYRGKYKLTKPANKNYRRSPRIISSSGAVYNPPVPLTMAQMRDWPAEGNNERPEYDPITGKIFPFDKTIRNIAKQYNRSNSGQNKDSYLISEFRLEKNDQSFPDLCHEMLHHVLAYVSTVNMLEKEKNKMADERSEEKVKFLQGLDLKEKNKKVETQVCEILHSIFDDATSEDETTNSLIELLKTSILLYCLTNNVKQSDVAKYIASVKPEDIISLSNEQLNISPINKD